MRRCSLAQCLVAHYLMGRAVASTGISGKRVEKGGNGGGDQKRTLKPEIGSYSPWLFSVRSSFSYFHSVQLLLWPDIYLCRLVIVRHNGKILYCQHFFLPAPSSGFFHFVSSSVSRLVLIFFFFTYPFDGHDYTDWKL